MIKRHFVLALVSFALTMLLLSATSAQTSVGDLLLYYDAERERPGITAFHPSTGEKLELPVTNGVEEIRTSGDGRIAYIHDNDVWVLDVLNTPYSPINVTQTPDEQESQLNWTPDKSLLQYQVGSDPGPYLLYIYDGIEITAVDYGYDLQRHWNEGGWYIASGDENGVGWYIWNGKERVDLTLPSLPSEPAWHTFLWTSDNHLFITIGYSEQQYMEPTGLTNIFYWNGIAVEEVKNPSGDETFMLGAWSYDGRLTLYTSQNYFDRWYIWDGVSFTPNGIPDTSTLAFINNTTEIIRDLEWMPDGRLAIVAEGGPELDSLLGHPFSCTDSCAPQVYLWDSQTLQQVTSNDFSGLLIEVHEGGRIAVSTFDGLRIWGVTIYDSNLEPIFQSDKRAYTLSRWSADGDLAYCRLNDLLVWNGQTSTQLSSTTTSKWLLAPSTTMLCSTG